MKKIVPDLRAVMVLQPEKPSLSSELAAKIKSRFCEVIDAKVIAVEDEDDEND